MGVRAWLLCACRRCTLAERERMCNIFLAVPADSASFGKRKGKRMHDSPDCCPACCVPADNALINNTVGSRLVHSCSGCCTSCCVLAEATRSVTQSKSRLHFAPGCCLHRCMPAGLYAHVVIKRKGKPQRSAAFSIAAEGNLLSCNSISVQRSVQIRHRTHLTLYSYLPWPSCVQSFTDIHRRVAMVVCISSLPFH